MWPPQRWKGSAYVGQVNQVIAAVIVRREGCWLASVKGRSAGGAASSSINLKGQIGLESCRLRLWPRACAGDTCLYRAVRA